jgi:hypothetical protein
MRLGSSVGAIAVDGQDRLFGVESNRSSALKPDGSRLGEIAVKGVARCLWSDDRGALWVTTSNSVTK